MIRFIARHQAWIMIAIIAAICSPSFDRIYVGLANGEDPDTLPWGSVQVVLGFIALRVAYIWKRRRSGADSR